MATAIKIIMHIASGVCLLSKQSAQLLKSWCRNLLQTSSYL